MSLGTARSTCFGYRALIVLACSLYWLGGCSNGRGSVESGEAQEPPPSAPASFEVSGTVSGLSGSGLVLQLNGTNDLPVSADGPFAFPTALQDGSAYAVSVAQQPANPAQTCTPQSATGQIAGADVTDVSILCSTESFAVGGSVTGLQGRGLVLRRNGEEDLPIAADGAFTFATPQASGTQYEITIATQPSSPSQTCTIANATGTVGSGDARSVQVTCATQSYTLSGTVAGLEGGTLVLRNSSDLVEVQANGAFTFPTAIASGGTYDVKVETAPSDPPQACTVTNGSGTVSDADVTNIEVRCALSEFTIGGTVGGLAGSGLVLQNNGADDLSINTDAPFTFATAVQTGRPYNVTVARQPTGPAQECSVTNGSGVVGSDNVTNIEVRCVTIEFTVGGSVSGLAGSGLRLQNNGGDTLAIAANGRYTFPTSLRTGSTYSVTVTSQPASPTQECTVSNGSGTITNANITNANVSCVTSRFPVAVQVSGLRGFSLRVSNNDRETLVIHSNGIHTFPTPIESGQTYNVVVISQPVLPFQTCVATNAQGTIGGSQALVSVSCD